MKDILGKEINEITYTDINYEINQCDSAIQWIKEVKVGSTVFIGLTSAIVGAVINFAIFNGESIPEYIISCAVIVGLWTGSLIVINSFAKDRINSLKKLEAKKRASQDILVKE